MIYLFIQYFNRFLNLKTAAVSIFLFYLMAMHPVGSLQANDDMSLGMAALPTTQKRLQDSSMIIYPESYANHDPLQRTVLHRPDDFLPKLPSMNPEKSLPDVSGPFAVSPQPLSRNEMGLLNWLLERIDPITGLLESFQPTQDPALHMQASTYDQALAGLVFLHLGFLEESESIADFYVTRYNGKAFANFYHTRNGNPGLEYTRHLGPNSWLGLFLLQLHAITKNKAYLELAEGIILWGSELNTHQGAFAMSDEDEWRAAWTEVYSTENNISFYALLNLYKQMKVGSLSHTEINFLLQDMEKFFANTIISHSGSHIDISRGIHSQKRDPVQALDTYSWLILAMNETRRSALGIQDKSVMFAIEEKFKGTDQDITGFDFTDETHRKAMGREPLISIEWTCGVVAAYLSIRTHKPMLAERYLLQARFYLNQMGKAFFNLKSNTWALPYATRDNEQVFKDSHWWRTPKDGRYYRAGSVASTTWYLLCTRINPMRPFDAIYS